MNKNKGFTLIELIGVITIIGIIALIAFKSVTSRIEKSKSKLYDVQINNILEATKKYMLSEETIDPYHTYTLCINIKKLQEKGFLEEGNIKNPKTNEVFTGSTKVKYNFEKEQYDYSYVEVCTEDKNTVPLVKSILNMEKVIVSGTNDGLYETTDSYVYRGLYPNNFIKFNNTIWRIISIDKETNMVKIINLNGGSDTVNSQKDLLTELNTNYETGTTYESVKEKINKNSKFNINNIDEINSALILKSKEKQTNDYKTIGLLSIGEYIDASTNKKCYSNNSCNSYLNISSKFILLNNKSNKEQWYVSTKGKVNSEILTGGKIYRIYPTLYLSLNTKLESGNGSKDNPYILK